jgi:hypothetical protein
MSIVDVGVPSGYQPEQSDLEALLLVHESLVTKFEITTRGVVFYLERISSARPVCITFRIVRQVFVANIQAAVVRVYDYYSPDDSCTQLYSPTRFTELLETTDCKTSVCRCARDNNCPQFKPLLLLGEIAVKQVIQSRDKLISLVCDDKYAFVWVGRVQSGKRLNGVRMLQFQIDTQLKRSAGAIATTGSQLNSSLSFVDGQRVWLTMSDECDLQAGDSNTDAVVFASAEPGSEHHLNGQAIYYAYGRQAHADAAHEYVGRLISWLKQKATREGWSCTNTGSRSNG